MRIESLKNRNVEFDVARAIAIFLMIIQHTWQLIFSGLFNNPTLDSIVLFIAVIFGAPVFLFIMGANIIHSQNNKPRQLFIRGLKLIILGYALSLIRFYLPLILLQHFGILQHPESILYKLQPIDYLLEVDILQVAGLSLMGIALLKYQKVKADYYLALALVIALISPFLCQINFSYPALTYLTEPFFGMARYVVFPFFPWFLYSLVGYYFGTILSREIDKQSFYRNCVAKIGVVLFLGLILLFVSLDSSTLSYWHHNLGSALILVSVVVYWLAIININYYRLSAKSLSILTFWSKNVTIIYIIQWIIIAWLAIIINVV
ncbi:MAG: heparan-alpha-glucosaminide N-acetyltransferase domain-containing protein [Patescibacteria group bacterium]